jgi:hypothetical protein
MQTVFVSKYLQLKPFMLAVTILVCTTVGTFAQSPASATPQDSSKGTSVDKKSNYQAPRKDPFGDPNLLRKTKPVERVPYPPLAERQQQYRNGTIKGPTPLVQYLMTEVEIVGIYKTQKTTGALLKVKGSSRVIGARVGDLFFNGPIKDILIYDAKKTGDEGGAALLPGQPAGEIECEEVILFDDDHKEYKKYSITYIPRR